MLDYTEMIPILRASASHSLNFELNYTLKTHFISLASHFYGVTASDSVF